MAAKRPKPGSRSDRSSTGRGVARVPAGEPVAPKRRGATTSGGPGILTVVAVVDGQTRETTGNDALKRLPEFLRQPKASVWVDLSGPSREQVEQVGGALGLHPLVIEDVLEGNQRAKIEITDGIVHIVLFHLDYDAELTASELDIVLGLGSCSPPTMRRGSRGRPTTCAPASSRSCATVRTTCCGPWPTTSSTGTSRSRTAWVMPSTRSRTRWSETPSPRRSSGCSR